VNGFHPFAIAAFLAALKRLEPLRLPLRFFLQGIFNHVNNDYFRVSRQPPLTLYTLFPAFSAALFAELFFLNVRLTICHHLFDFWAFFIRRFSILLTSETFTREPASSSAFRIPSAPFLLDKVALYERA
jgi:hypothetical protein